MSQTNPQIPEQPKGRWEWVSEVDPPTDDEPVASPVPPEDWLGQTEAQPQEVAAEPEEAPPSNDTGETGRSRRRSRISIALQVTIAIMVIFTLGITINLSYNNTVARESAPTPTVTNVYDTTLLPTSPPPIVAGQVIKPSSYPPVGPGVQKWVDSGWLDYWASVYGVPERIQRVVIKNESGGDSSVRGQWLQTYDNGELVSMRAVGLFQVLPFRSRFAGVENPFDPEVNAREGLKYLRGCNEKWGSGDWDGANNLFLTFQCYFGGEAGGSNWGDSTERYATILLRDLGLAIRDTSGYYRTASDEMMMEKMAAPPPNANQANACYTDLRECNDESDWAHGWCESQIKLAWKGRESHVGLNTTMSDCVSNLGYPYREHYG